MGGLVEEDFDLNEYDKAVKEYAKIAKENPDMKVCLYRMRVDLVMTNK